MLKRKNEIDVKLLRFAIEKTVGFETIVEKRFQGNTVDQATNPITNHSNRKSFEPALTPFLPSLFVAKVTASNENDNASGANLGKPKVSPFQGIISQCFEDHLDIYIGELDR